MKTYLLFFVILSITLFSCEEKVREGDTAFFYYEKSEISSTYPWVVAGNTLVFHRYYRADDVIEIADDEYSEDFMFEVVTNSDSFSFENQALEDLNILFKRHCFCYQMDTAIISGGKISGTKRGGRWKVSVDIKLKEGYIDEHDSLVFFDEFPKTFDGEFKKSTYDPN